MSTGSGVDYNTLSNILFEIQNQPAWRLQADREDDYCDGNQLDSKTLRELESKGVPPSIENLIGPVIEDITGMEEKNRTDWKVDPDAEHDQEAQDIADAIGYKLNQAERRSGADMACTKTYAGMVKVGLDWIEVSRNPDPFQFPYRCLQVHRREIYWDFLSKQPDLSDARWLLRRRWTDADIVKMMFPKKKDLISIASNGWNQIDALSMLFGSSDGTTDLAQAQDIERGWSVDQQEWRTPETNRVCLFELLTRKFEQAIVLKMPAGRVVEFDKNNPMHIMAMVQGMPIDKAIVSRIYKTFFLGPHKLAEEESEFKRFNYVPFWGKRESNTGIPYGIIRWLMYLQDEVNARISKQQWLLSAVRTERTQGAVAMEDSVFRDEVGRPDADIILDKDHMSLSGARFEVIRNEDLNQQQYQRLQDLRETIKRISHVSDSFAGQAAPTNNSAMSQAVEQTVQGLASINGNFEYSRKQVGELLMSLIIADMGTEQQEITLKGNLIREDKTIVLNTPIQDPDTGHQYLTNDVTRAILKVTLEEVPSTPSFRQQQLSALSEAFKASPPQFQAIMMPHLMSLTNVPDKEEIIKAILEINKNASITEEQVQQRIKDAVEQAKTQMMIDQKNRDLDLKERRMNADIDLIVAEKINKAITSIYSATQAAMQINAVPGVAPSADQILKSSGFQDQDLPPIVASPGVGVGVRTGEQPPVQPGQYIPSDIPVVHKNTSPAFPPVVPDAGTGEPGNIPGEMPMPTADTGMDRGIEKQGVQI